MHVNDSAPHSEPAPEEGEPTSFADKTKNWYERHKPKIRVVGGVTLAVGLAVVRHIAERPGVATQDADRPGAESLVDFEQSAVADTAREPRQTPTPHLRNLGAGRKASPGKRAQFKEETGGELPPNTTYVNPQKGEGPGEAAA
ncbi:hypothetical protein [Streptomyces sp. NPDC018321]|uniref:hypothetical protein n=1 Tax=unclassified Streptomyces TaxID=2593676 RepID=UPI0037B02C39